MLQVDNIISLCVYIIRMYFILQSQKFKYLYIKLLLRIREQTSNLGFVWLSIRILFFVFIFTEFSKYVFGKQFEFCFQELF